MLDVVKFFNSEYSEPSQNLYSLGGKVGSVIESNVILDLFQSVDSYYSTNRFYDYRVLYIKNVSPQNIVALNPIIYVQTNFYPYLDRARIYDLSKIKINFLVPPYVTKNYIHPIITPDGIITTTGQSLDSFMSTSTISNYSYRLSLDVELLPNDFFPIIIRREVEGPLPLITNYVMKTQIFYGVVA